jgi:NTE family protein
MLSIQAAEQPRPKSQSHRFGLAIAGGGPIGAIYEIGALRAIEDALLGVKLTQADVYVGVSSGAFMAAGLANQLSAADMARIFINSESSEFPFQPSVFLRPAFGEFLARSAALPKALTEALWRVIRAPLRGDRWAAIGALGKVIPNGLFDNELIDDFLRRVFTAPGRTNDFRQLPAKLIIVAVELDSGATVQFGRDARERVPISKAVQASSALPGLYLPVEINGKHYVDGVLRRTLHASMALDEGVDLLLALNPLVAYDAKLSRRRGKGALKPLVEGGLPVVLAQTFRTLIQSRMQVGFGKYLKRYEAADLVLFEPDADDDEVFFTNAFSFASRRRLCQHAYQQTMRDFRNNFAVLSEVFGRHNIELNKAAIFDTNRTFGDAIERERSGASGIKKKLGNTLDKLEKLLADQQG